MGESRKQFEQAYEQLRKDGQTINLWDVWSMAWTASRASRASREAIDIIGGVEASMYLYQAAAATTLFDKQRFICKAIEKLSVRKN